MAQGLVLGKLAPVAVVPHLDDVGVDGLAGALAAGDERHAEGLVAETLAVLVDPAASSGTEEAHGEGARGTAHGGTGTDLHHAAGPDAHLDAVAVAARANELRVGVALLHLGAQGVVHVGVGGEIAHGQNDADLGVDLLVGAALVVLHDGTRDLAVLLDEDDGRGTKERLRIGACLDALVDGGCAESAGALKNAGAEVQRGRIGPEVALLVVIVATRLNSAYRRHGGNVGLKLHHPVDHLAVALGELLDEVGLGTAGALKLVRIDEVPRVKRVLGHAEDLLLPLRVEVTQLAAVRGEAVLVLGVDAHDGQALLGRHAEALRAGVAQAEHHNVGVNGLGDVGLGDDRSLAHPVAAHGVVDGVAVLVDTGHVVLTGVGRGGGRGAHGAAGRRTALGTASRHAALGGTALGRRISQGCAGSHGHRGGAGSGKEGTTGNTGSLGHADTSS